MRAVVQRVLSASVTVDGEVIGQCGPGLLLLVAAHRDDTIADAQRLAERLSNLRIFNDPEGKMNLSILDVKGEFLAVSNFTVYGDADKSRRPSFTRSAPYETGKELFEAFVAALYDKGRPVAKGEFGADMQVSLVNDGPVTVIVDAGPSGATG